MIIFKIPQLLFFPYSSSQQYLIVEKMEQNKQAA